MATALEIHAIADQISAKGGTPTLAAVRAALGGGSFTTISEAMKQWKTARQASSVPMREAAQAALAEAQKRADELAGLLKQERDARAAADLSKSSAVQLAAVTASELNAAERRGTEAEAREKVALSERIEAEKQAASARQAEQQARIAEQAAQARLEAAAREIEQAKKSIKEARDEAKASSEAAAELRGRLAAIDHVEQQKEENSLNKPGFVQKVGN